MPVSVARRARIFFAAPGVVSHRLRSALRAVFVGVLVLGLTTCRIDQLVNSAAPVLLVVSPTQLLDSAAVGSAAAVQLSAEVTTTGGGSISWQASPAHASPWLTLDQASGSIPGAVSVTLDPTGLPMGVHRDTILITVGSSGAEPARLPVEFQIHACDVHSVTTNATAADILSSADCAAPHRSGRFAKLFNLNAAENDSLTVELRSSEFAGYLVLVREAVAAVMAESGDCPGVAGAVCLRYVRVPAAGSYVIEATTANAGESGAFALTIASPRPPQAPAALRQLRADSASPVSVGAAIPDHAFVVSAALADSDLADSVRLEVELAPVGTVFGGIPTATSAAIPAGDTARVLVAGLQDDQSYHWQARSRDATGRTSAWVAFGGNPESAADIRVATEQPPSLPTGLMQQRSDAATAIPLGGTTPEQTVVFRGMVSDPDPSDVLRLEVEVQPVGMPFTGTATGSSVQVANGASAVVTVAGLSVDTGYRWRARAVDGSAASSAWLDFGGNPDTEADFRVVSPPATLAVSGVPDPVTAGAVSGVTVTVHDQAGNVATGYTGRIAFTSTDAGASLPAAYTFTAGDAGSHTFANAVILRTAGEQTVTATDQANTAITGSQTAITVQPAPTVSLTVGGISDPIIAGASSDVTVTARDSLGNLTPAYAGTVTFSSSDATAALPAPYAFTGADAGTHTFAGGVRLRLTGEQSVSATDGTRSASQTAITVQAAPVDTLRFGQQPSTTAAGDVISPAPTVEARDSIGNVATGFTGTITVAIATGTGTAGAALTGTKSVAAQAGIATFGTLRIDSVGTGYRLSATASGVKATQSAAFGITTGAANHLTFLVQPTNTTAGATINPSTGVQVAVRDAQGNLVPTFSGSVSLVIASGTGSPGATLGGTVTRTVLSGIATFDNLFIQKVGTGYQLNALSTATTGATSNTFDITPAPAATLVVSGIPDPIIAGATSSVTVTARDAYGNVATGYRGTIHFTSTDATAVLPADYTFLAQDHGVHTFTNNVRLRLAGERSVTATDQTTSSITGSQSAITVQAAPPDSLVFTQPPSTTVAGSVITPAPVVTARDSIGNVVTSFTGMVTVAIASGTGTPGAALTGTLSVAAQLGAATFGNLRIDSVGTGYRLSATATGLKGTLSNTFAITVGAPDHLLFDAQPTTTTAGAIINASGGVKVSVRDASGNLVTTFSGSITLAITSGPSGASLGGTNPQTVSNGVATFGDLFIQKSGSGYRLTASASGVPTGATSTTFNITAASAVSLLVSGINSTVVAGEASTVTVTPLDTYGNVATGYTGTIHFTSSDGVAVLPLDYTFVAGSNGHTFVNGVRLRTAGEQSVTATDMTTGTITGTQAGISVEPAPVAKLTVSGIPDPIVAGTNANVSVVATDSIGNTATGYTGTIHFTSSDGAATLPADYTFTSGDNSAHTFVDAVVLKTAGEQSVTATDAATSSITGAQTAITVSATAATQLVFSRQPRNTKVNATMTPSVRVSAVDPYLNVNPNFVGAVSLAFDTDPSGGAATLSGTIPVTAVAGVANFTDLSIDVVADGYTLVATTTGLTQAVSNTFNITP